MPRIFGVLLLLALAWGVFAFGGVYPWAFWPLAGVSAVLGAWAARRGDAWGDPRTRTLALALLGVAAAMAIQLVVLPYGMVEMLSPGFDGLFARSVLGYRAPAWHALSIDPAATLVVLGLAVSLGLLLVGLVRTVRSIGSEWLVLRLMGIGVALALVGIVQRAVLEPEHMLVYGFWEPRQGGQPFGPFINRNHFAGWMVMILPLVLGYSCAAVQLARKPRLPGWKAWLAWLPTVEANRVVLVVVAAVVMGGALALTRSRSGLAALAAALVVLGYFVVRRAPTRQVRVLGIGYVSVMLVAAAAWAGVDQIALRFGRASTEIGSRWQAWRDTLGIIRDFWPVGTGMGGYDNAMLVYQSQGRELMYAQAHNDYLQIAAEGGVLVTIPVILLVAVVVRTIWHRMTSGDDDVLTGWIRAGAVAGLCGIAVQSLVEFSLQMPGNAVTFVVLLALALHRPGRQVIHAHRV